MDIINEAALKERQTLGQLVNFRIGESEGQYQLLCRFMWQKSEVHLITQRKKIRTWSSLDSLVEYIDKTFGSVPTIFIRNFTDGEPNGISNAPPGSSDHPEGDIGSD